MVWPFGERRSKPSKIRGLAPAGLVDLHGHVLAGLDDGPGDEAASRAMLDAYAALGYARVAATPHWLHSGFATPTLQEIERLVAAANASRNGAPPELLAGAEIAFDERFQPALAANELPRLGLGRAYLVELSALPGALPRGLDELVFRLTAKGVAIVLAHVERIPDLRRDRGPLADLRRAGALVQIDLVSLAGKHGRTARQHGWRLVELGAADVVATDAHASGDLSLAGSALEELALLDASEAVRLASTNPGKILDGSFDEVARHD
jgi:protein-tyrosine phosphatase